MMNIPFWLLIIFSTADVTTITSITPFQTEPECNAAQKVVEAIKLPERQSFNVYTPKQTAVCEKAVK